MPLNNSSGLHERLFTTLMQKNTGMHARIHKYTLIKTHTQECKVYSCTNASNEEDTQINH